MIDYQVNSCSSSSSVSMHCAPTRREADLCPVSLTGFWASSGPQSIFNGQAPSVWNQLEAAYRMGVTAERCTDGYEVQRKGLGRVARLGRFKEEETQVGVRWENLGGRRSRRSKRGGGRKQKWVECIAPVFAHVRGVGDSQVLTRQPEGVGQMWGARCAHPGS